MSLNELLRNLVCDCGALGALVMTADGFPLEEYRSDDLFDLDGCAVEFASFLADTRHVTTLLENGGVEELSLLTERIRVVIRTLSVGMAFFLVLPADAPYGKARYLMRRDQHKILEAMQG